MDTPADTSKLYVDNKSDFLALMEEVAGEYGFLSVVNYVSYDFQHWLLKSERLHQSTWIFSRRILADEDDAAIFYNDHTAICEALSPSLGVGCGGRVYELPTTLEVGAFCAGSNELPTTLEVGAFYAVFGKAYISYYRQSH